MGNLLRLGIPGGSLHDTTIALFKRAGYTITFPSRSYYSSLEDDIECTMVRAQEMARYVEQGVLDAGITGYDWVVENQVDVKELADLLFSRASRNPVRWVLCVPDGSPFQTVEDLRGKRIATEAVGLAQQFFARKGIPAKIEFSWGATEAKAPRFADAIIELTETGSSIRANHLRIIDEVLVSTSRFIANHAAYRDEWKRRKMDSIVLSLLGALAAEEKVGLWMHVRRDCVSTVLPLLSLKMQPTVSQLLDPDWCAVNTIVEKSSVRTILPRLKEAGAEGIVEYPLNKVIE